VIALVSDSEPAKTFWFDLFAATDWMQRPTADQTTRQRRHMEATLESRGEETFEVKDMPRGVGEKPAWEFTGRGDGGKRNTNKKVLTTFRRNDVAARNPKRQDMG
jgi:hypothetical protein